MMKFFILIKVLRLFALLFLLSSSVWAVPTITGTPKIVFPDLLDWPVEHSTAIPDLTEPTANRISDLHGQISRCDMVLSTAGNYHMALKELWQHYLHRYQEKLDIKTWYYTTSPPISVPQIANKTVLFGNLKLDCVPQVAVGPKKLIKKLQAANMTAGKPIKILKNQGNVILVKKGNPKNIHSVWDLGRADVTLVTPNPKMEAGSFGNFSSSIYNIAKNDPKPPAGNNAELLFNSIFNDKQDGCGSMAKQCRWVAGKRIMHREQAWAVYSGKADAGFIFYHLALYFVRSFPEQFEIVPLGGTVDQPKPVLGNKVGVLQAVTIKGDWTKNQLAAQQQLMIEFQSEQFTNSLLRHGIRRP